MDLAVLTTLEYDKIRTMLVERAGSVAGKEIAAGLTPTNDRELVGRWLNETEEAVRIQTAAVQVPLGGSRDIRSIIKRAELGAILEPHEFLPVSSTLYTARRMKAFFTEWTDQTPGLCSLAEGIIALPGVEKAIEATVNEQGAIRDDASAELLHIRREIKQAQNRVKEKLNSILHSGEYQKYFQDVLVTMRGDRYVIPIKQECRQYFPGIVHDQSASGATVFIEPMAVVDINNAIKQLMAAEKHEIERILNALTSQIARVSFTIQNDTEILAKLDFIFAKARLALDMRGSKAVINDAGIVYLQKARHPLIAGDKVVPIDVWLGKEFNMLLITGPNTGGKTVTLKTVGLFALMTQAGLFIPAASGSEMPVFQNIFADIGDEQSIEQSLSTFSAHMTNLVRILSRVSENDLLLIDEIGAGTDPDEGAALAMAILEDLLADKVKTIATTHYSDLKAFAYSRHGIENACVEFDIQTLRPTYRLLIGLPGSSNAFAITKRLGLAESIIERAKQLVDKDYAEFETVLSNLESQKRTLSQQQEEVAALERQVAQIKETLMKEKEALTGKRTAILTKAQNDAAALVRQTRREAEVIINELKSQFASQDAKTRQNVIHQARTKLREQMNALHNLEEDAEPAVEVTADMLKPGMSVYVTTLKQNGTILAVGTNEATVQLGIMKMNVPFQNCRILPARNEEKKAGGKIINLSKTQETARQVDIRGMTVEEAEPIVDKYLDDAVLAGLKEVIVIHGKGTGALRKGIRSYLKEHPYVKEIRLGEAGEGGDGATVVSLR
ncbi:dna mismatch repair protein muts core [Lucifera butyrica]|uniref:Endonuclease MutS2 n=1 Tax=Lucifera butyrica TaxID=1351585 RepID=A0A498RBD7_9FIRM|nr:endonuclease MutS2 [Lucifera butyrica]VBB08771.1 dna mismatch repair protein muts core [Lucifera butyrica]